jgi:hypothetical protein
MTKAERIKYVFEHQRQFQQQVKHIHHIVGELGKIDERFIRNYMEIGREAFPLLDSVESIKLLNNFETLGDLLEIFSGIVGIAEKLDREKRNLNG